MYAYIYRERESYLVDKIDGFIGKVARRYIAVGQRSGGDERCVFDDDAVVGFVTFAESAED